jgi:hypothetical protein
MTHISRDFAGRIVGILAIAMASFGAVAGANAQTYIGSNVDERVTVALRANVAAVESWLPAGWKVSSPNKGPFQGANLMAVFVDRLLQMDAEGNLAGGGSFRAVAFVVPAHLDGTAETASFVIRIYAPQDGDGPYKNNAKADVQRQVTQQGTSVGAGSGSETWQMRPAGGGELTLKVDYQREVPQPQAKEVRPYSAVDPSFFRIYQVNQLVDIVQSTPAGIDRAPNHSLNVNIPELASMFDGTEKIVGIAVTPSYARQTFLP